MNILCVGHAAYDITFPVLDFPKENTKNRLHEKVECGGGPASNGAYLLAKWGLPVYFMGVVGNDYYGKKIKEELNNIHVDTTYLEMSDQFPTTVSTIIANQKNGSRTILTYRDSNMQLSNKEISFTPDIILMDGQEMEVSNNLVDKFPNAITIIDAGRPTEEIISLSKKVKYVVCSKEFAETIANEQFTEERESYIRIFTKMKEIFPGEIVITLESKGCLYEYNNRIKVMPSIQVKAIDSTGAGDIFHGAFTYGIAKKWPYEKILQMANITGALSVTKVGGRFSIPTIEEMKKIYEDFE